LIAVQNFIQHTIYSNINNSQVQAFPIRLGYDKIVDLVLESSQEAISLEMNEMPGVDCKNKGRGFKGVYFNITFSIKAYVQRLTETSQPIKGFQQYLQRGLNFGWTYILK